MSYLMSLFCQNTDELQAGTERNVLRMLEAVLEASAVVIVDLILVLRIDILAAIPHFLRIIYQLKLNVCFMIVFNIL